MKKIYLFVTLLIASLNAIGQDDITLCHTSSTDKFALFASNKDFRSQHKMPRAYVHITQAGGKMITFDCADGKKASGYFIEAKKKTNNWIFVFQEWWGLNEHIKREAEQLYNDLGNVNVIALDMYDGQVTDNPDDARKYMQSFQQGRGDAIVAGALALAGPKAKVGTIGWCFGGGQSLMATLTVGKQAAGCVIYYGMPVDDVAKLKTLTTDVLGIFATKDKFITTEVVTKFEANMKAAGKTATIKNYDADHGFANPSSPERFDEKSAKDAYGHTLTFFKARLK